MTGSLAVPSTWWTRAGVVLLWAVLAAVAVNLLAYAVGRAAGGSFRFTQDGVAARVDAVTVAGFTLVPLTVGLVAMAILAYRWPRVTTIAKWFAPALALITIAIMTLPVDLDLASTVSLAACHVSLAVISVLAVRAMARGRVT